MKVVIDTNIFISALINKESLIREIIINSDFDFLFPEFEFQEIYKYKDEILRKSKLSEIEFIKATSTLLNHVRIINYEEIYDYYSEAFQIMHEIDSDDIIFIATALTFNAVIWSEDSHFKMQNRIRTLTTQEIKDYLNLK